MTGSSRDIDEESGDWDTVDINVEITADTDNDSLDWDTVDTDSEHDGVQDDDYDPPITTDPRARLRERFEVICAVWTAVIEAVSLATERTEPIAYHTSILSGGGWMLELLSGHPERIRTELGVHKHVFRVLVDELQRSGYSHSKQVTLQEQLGIFLYIVVTGLTIRHVGERFQRSNGTISKYFKRMLAAFTSPGIYAKYVQLPRSDAPTHPYILDNPKFFPFFVDAIGAIDGTHVACAPAADERAASRNRKGFTSQNCLVCCNFDLQFTYVLSGWEGSMADATIYHNARMSDLKIPDGKYYLADAGFPNCPQLLVPYRGQRYHLAEWGRAQTRPANSLELYNLCHASARNVVERIIGVLKRRFRILTVPPEYSMRVQARIPPALACIHNIIRTWDPVDLEDPEENPEENPESQDMGMSGSVADGVPTNADRDWMSAKRDRITECMWASYIAERARRV